MITNKTKFKMKTLAMKYRAINWTYLKYKSIRFKC